LLTRQALLPTELKKLSPLGNFSLTVHKWSTGYSVFSIQYNMLATNLFCMHHSLINAYGMRKFINMYKLQTACPNLKMITHFGQCLLTKQQITIKYFMDKFTLGVEPAII
jgi:hypothetical protein